MEERWGGGGGGGGGGLCFEGKLKIPFTVLFYWQFGRVVPCNTIKVKQ